jgi:hypothetical protein
MPNYLISLRLSPILWHLLWQSTNFLEKHDISIDAFDELNESLPMSGSNPIQVPRDDSHDGGSMR